MWFLKLIGYYQSCYQCGAAYRNERAPSIQVCRLCEIEIRARAQFWE
jgi:hypothetical protein